MISRCVCNSAFQDARYGKGMRVHTEGKKGDLRCTVCSGDPVARKMRSQASAWLPAFSLAPKYPWPRPVLPA